MEMIIPSVGSTTIACTEKEGSHHHSSSANIATMKWETTPIAIWWAKCNDSVRELMKS